MIGQITNSEFLSLFERTSYFRKGFNAVNGTAWLMYGASTINYYMQHKDGSWTNYKCRTSG
jgi:hypothetical protein